MYKKVNVVMLPTNEKAKIGKYLVLNKENKLCIWDTNKMGTQNTLPVQNLYILSDEKIKKGALIGYPNLNTWVPVQYLGGDLTGKERKIIATTDKSLTLQYIGSKLYDESKTPNYYGFKSGVGLNSHLKTVNLPQPSRSFLEVFVREYNKGNIITEVMVEYEEYRYTMEEQEKIGSKYNDNYGYVRLKINPDNTINIKPIKISKYEDLYKAIDKIKEGHKGSAINFIERFINTQKN